MPAPPVPSEGLNVWGHVKQVPDRFLYALCRLAAIDLRLSEVGERTYRPIPATPAHDLDKAQAEFLFKMQREDSAHTDDKVKQLLTLSSSLATIILAFVRDVRPRGLVVFVLAVLFACVYLCISVLEVRTGQTPTPGDAGQPSDDLDQEWASDLTASLFANRRAQDYRVDRYRAAGRYFRLAFLLTPVLAWCTVPRPNTAVVQQAALERAAKATEDIGRAVERLGAQVDSARTQGVPIRAPTPIVVRPAPGAVWQGATPPTGAAQRRRSSTPSGTGAPGSPR